MDNDWINKPIKNNFINHETTHIIGIDESGSASYIKQILKLINNNELNKLDNDRRFFTLCAVIFNKFTYVDTQKKIKKLKEKHWPPKGKFDYREGTKDVCLHTSEINHKVGPFSPNKINYQAFIEDLTNTLDSLECKIIAVNVDLFECAKSGIYNIYELAFQLILERIIFSAPNNLKASIYLESRGAKEDKELLKSIKSAILISGIGNISNTELNEKVLGIYFNPKYNEKNESYNGLEIADLFAYPIHKNAVNDKPRKDFEIIKSKIYGYPNKMKFGLINYPKK